MDGVSITTARRGIQCIVTRCDNQNTEGGLLSVFFRCQFTVKSITLGVGFNPSNLVRCYREAMYSRGANAIIAGELVQLNC